MSARKVCRGTRPSRYHSERAISAPFSRPETLTLMPCAPSRMVVLTARRMARRNITRRSSCEAMFSATSRAWSSGFLISLMLTRTWCSLVSISLARSRLSLSMSSPFLPMTVPGRAVWIWIWVLSRWRSMSIWLTAASLRRLRSISRMR